MAPTWASTKTGGRTLLRLATAGSVDDGKSTLVGRLLYDTNSVLTDTLDHVEKVIEEVASTRVTERGATRGDDKFSEAAMEDRKREGYF
jgi:GTPase